MSTVHASPRVSGADAPTSTTTPDPALARHVSDSIAREKHPPEVFRTNIESAERSLRAADKTLESLGELAGLVRSRLNVALLAPIDLNSAAMILASASHLKQLVDTLDTQSALLLRRIAAAAELDPAWIARKGMKAVIAAEDEAIQAAAVAAEGRLALEEHLRREHAVDEPEADQPDATT